MAETAGLAALGINPLYLVGQVVNFVILLWVLKKFLYGPVLRKLEERSKKTEQAEKTAEALEKRQAEWQEKQERQLQKLKQKTADLLAEAAEQAKQEKKRIVGEAQTEAKVAAQAEYVKLEQKIKDQEKQLKEATGELVVATTRKLLSTYLGKSLQSTILNKQVEKLKTLKIK